MTAPLSHARLRDAAHALIAQALEPDPLPRWAGTLADVMEVDVAALTVLSPEGLAVANGTSDRHLRLGEEYIEKYQFDNPLHHYWMHAPCGQIRRIDDSLVDDRMRRGAFYTRFGDIFARGDTLCMVLHARGTRVLLHVGQPAGGGHRATRADIGTGAHDDYRATVLTQLQRDLHLAFEISGRLMLARNLASGISRSLDHKGVGLIVLDESGRIEEVNASAEGVLARGVILRSDGGYLSPGRGVALPQLPQMLQRARRGQKGGQIDFLLEDGQIDGSITVYPAAVTPEWERLPDNKVVLLVIDNNRPRALLTQALASTHGLTNAEMRVALKLVAGNTTRAIADELGVQINSIRAHLKAIYAKTDTHSQIELVNYLQNLARKV